MAEATTYQNFIAGQWRDSSDGQFEVKSPADGSLVYRAQRSTGEDIRAAIAAAREAFETTDWKDDPSARTTGLMKFSEAVRARPGPARGRGPAEAPCGKPVPSGRYARSGADDTPRRSPPRPAR